MYSIQLQDNQIDNSTTLAEIQCGKQKQLVAQGTIE